MEEENFLALALKIQRLKSDGRIQAEPPIVAIPRP